jgi:hypothetical protein
MRMPVETVLQNGLYRVSLKRMKVVAVMTRLQHMIPLSPGVLIRENPELALSD